jgi:ATP adenylyltransferase
MARKRGRANPIASDLRLWAPWRYQYIAAPDKKSSRCIFCFARVPNAAERRRLLLLHIDDTASIMLNRYPYNNGHLMIAPRRQVASPELLDPAERAAIMELISESVVVLRKALRPAGFNVGANLGKTAGAGIADHMHWHIVPRWEGDTNFMPVLGSTRVISQHLLASFDTLAPLFKGIGARIS